MQMTPIFALALVSFLFNASLGVYVFFSNRQAAKDKELQDAKLRIGTLEERVRNMPDHTLVTEMLGDMKAVRVEVSGLKDSISPLVRSVDRINDYLLSHK